MKIFIGRMYKVVFRKSAEKQLLKLPKGIGNEIISRIKSLSENPIPDEAKKMIGFDNIFRIRFRNYRIIL